MPGLPSHVLAARAMLAEGLDAVRQRHESGGSGIELCGAIARTRDRAIGELFEVAGARPDQMALVAHGGYGRCDVAPYSDVDLMLLHTTAGREEAAQIAGPLWRDVFDLSLAAGHSVRTPDQAVHLASGDPTIATSLIESRLIAGSDRLFERFEQTFRRHVRRRGTTLLGAVVHERQQERSHYGETVYLLEPNIKRSAGCLRDLQLIRWVGFLRYGTPELQELAALDALSKEDVTKLEQAWEFLLRLRNEMHFHGGKAIDVLDRDQQLRIAEQFGYQGRQGVLPVEQFMQDVFRHCGAVSHLSQRFTANAQSKRRMTRLVTAVFGHKIDSGLHAGPAGLVATQRGLDDVRGNLAAVMRMADLANLHNKPITSDTWEAIRREVPRMAEVPSREACEAFLSLLGNPARLESLLHDLHDVGLLERFVPAMARARGLIQFNQYHKYTVDEHCLQAVGFATRLLFDMNVLGRTYRRIAEKRVLHLALLIHDLGKGLPEDHRDAGREIAVETARRLHLSEQQTERLEFLVHRHQAMNFLAFRRDVTDGSVVVQFAREVGSPEMLQMMFVLTASDMAAVGPGVWDGWKADILTDLFHRAMEHLAGESPDATDPNPAAEEPDDLSLLAQLKTQDAVARAEYLPETQTVQFTIGSREELSRGAFHKLTGVLTGCGLEIRSARINTLADGLVLDRFVVHDPDYAERPPDDRLETVNARLVRVLQSTDETTPAFRRTWQSQPAGASPAAAVEASVHVDNNTSDHYTILDVFAVDRPGLLYAVARELYRLDLSVWRAKIGTHLDQVVDVFYVTDRQDRKVEDPQRLERIQARLLEVVGVT